MYRREPGKVISLNWLGHQSASEGKVMHTTAGNAEAMGVCGPHQGVGSVG